MKLWKKVFPQQLEANMVIIYKSPQKENLKANPKPNTQIV